MAAPILYDARPAPTAILPSDIDYDSGAPSPYPASSDSESDSQLSPLKCSLRRSITSIPESQLRAIMLKLADKNPKFERAITKELSYSIPSFSASPPLTPTTKRHSRGRTRHRSRQPLAPKAIDVSQDRCMNCHRRLADSVHDSDAHEEMCVYHPGHLEKEAFEFLTMSPGDQKLKPLRMITMWSCCDEDEWSPGCAMASSHFIPAFGTIRKGDAPPPGLTSRNSSF